jgi:hypothetical protein
MYRYIRLYTPPTRLALIRPMRCLVAKRRILASGPRPPRRRLVWIVALLTLSTLAGVAALLLARHARRRAARRPSPPLHPAATTPVASPAWASAPGASTPPSERGIEGADRMRAGPTATFRWPGRHEATPPDADPDDILLSTAGAAGDELAADELAILEARADGAPAPLRLRRLTPAQRARRGSVALGSVLLALALLLATAPPGVRADLRGALFGPTPPPPPRPNIADGRYFFVPEVPWGTLTLDGHPFAAAIPGDANVPMLPVGRHTLEWRAAPFHTLRCLIAVPEDTATDTCDVTSFAHDGRYYALIQDHHTLETLNPAPRAALRAVLQAALDATAASTILQPGEPYAGPALIAPSDPAAPNALIGSLVWHLADRPLLATLRFTLAAATKWSEPCAQEPGIFPCDFPGQDCRQLCTLPPALLPAGASRSAWYVAALAQGAWTFTTLAGRPVGAVVPEPFGPVTVVLRVTWDGAAWHAVPLFTPAQGGPLAAAAACATGRQALALTRLAYIYDFGLAPEQSLDSPALRCFSVADPAAGVLLSLTGYLADNSAEVSHGPAALFLVRCGVLLAANAVAHHLLPAQPQADASELALAAGLLAAP